MRWSSIGIYRRAAANGALAAPGNRVTASFLEPTGYHNGLILLMIARSSGIGKATC
ncbi:hypothetical protein D3C80_2071030 [compost metagenome]